MRSQVSWEVDVDNLIAKAFQKHFQSEVLQKMQNVREKREIMTKNWYALREKCVWRLKSIHKIGISRNTQQKSCRIHFTTSISNKQLLSCFFAPTPQKRNFYRTFKIQTLACMCNMVEHLWFTHVQMRTRRSRPFLCRCTPKSKTREIFDDYANGIEIVFRLKKIGEWNFYVDFMKIVRES